MDNNNLSFLSSIVLDATAGAPPRKVRTGKSRNPETADLRIYKDGSIYPSLELVEKLNLAYQADVKDAEGKWKEAEHPGFGFDISDSKEFPAFKLPAGVRVLVISTVNRIHGKVDVFGSVTRFTEKEETEGLGKAGTPKVSVEEQGSKTFGAANLLPWLAEIYGVVPNADGFIDMKIIGQDATLNTPWQFDNPVYVPKTLSRGDDRGKKTATRREGGKFFVLMPVKETAGIVSPTTTGAAKEEEPQASEINN